MSVMGDVTPTIHREVAHSVRVNGFKKFSDGKMSGGAYDGIRTICTEQPAWRATASETLPRKKRPSPLRS